MAVLDASVVNVAAPSIHAGLHASGAGLQLVIAGYTITYAVLLVSGARVGDLLGHRRVFLAGLAFFTLASLGCGLAASTTQLVGLRLVQGVGAAAMIPQVLSLIQRTFPGPGRARAMSAYSAVLALGIVVGQVAGGLLISADLFGASWRPVFLVERADRRRADAGRLAAAARGPGRGQPRARPARPGLADPGGAGRGDPARARPARALASLGLVVPGRQHRAVRRIRDGRAQARGSRRIAAGACQDARAGRACVSGSWLSSPS